MLSVDIADPVSGVYILPTKLRTLCLRGGYCHRKCESHGFEFRQCSKYILMDFKSKMFNTILDTSIYGYRIFQIYSFSLVVLPTGRHHNSLKYQSRTNTENNENSLRTWSRSEKSHTPLGPIRQ